MVALTKSYLALVKPSGFSTGMETTTELCDLKEHQPKYMQKDTQRSWDVKGTSHLKSNFI